MNLSTGAVTTLTTGTYGAITYSYSNVPTGALSGTGACRTHHHRVGAVLMPGLYHGRAFARGAWDSSLPVRSRAEGKVPSALPVA